MPDVIRPSPVTDDALIPGEITAGFVSDASRCYVLACAYVFARISRKVDRVSILDFGGALGGYYRVYRNAVPDVAVDYTVFELPELCEFGKQARPDVRFVSSEAELDQSYTLVLASGSLQCFEDWKGKLQLLASRASPWLFVTRVMIFDSGTKLLSQAFGNEDVSVWGLGHAELLREADRHQLKFVDVFDLQEEFEEISGIHERPKVRGYLFRKA